MRLLLLIALLSALPARAEDDARTVYADARSEYDLGHFRRALELFERVYKARLLPGLLFNIAQCHRKLGELKEAADTYRSFLVHADPASVEAQRAHELLAEVENAIHSEQRATEAAPHGTAPLAATPAPPRPPPPAFVPVAPKPLEPARPRSHTLAYALGGTAVAAVAVGTVFGLQSKSAGSDLSSGQLNRSGNIDQVYSDYQGKAKVADALFVISIALGAGMVIAW